MTSDWIYGSNRRKRKPTTMTMLDLRIILVLCCFLQMGCLGDVPFPTLCPPQSPHQYGMYACFSINEEALTFDKALASCIAKGGKLAEPRTRDQTIFTSRLVYPDNKSHDYWLGVTDASGVWTYASDNSPLSYLFTSLQYSFPPNGHQCLVYKGVEENQVTGCEQKARSICQFAPEQVCGIREGGELIPFNATYKMDLVTLPCDYIMAHIVCGDYDVSVYGNSGPVGKGIPVFSPLRARVAVQRVSTRMTLVSAEVSRDAIAKSTDGKNLWTVLSGEWSTAVSEAFEPARQAAVIKIGDVGQVDFSASADGVENGLYVRCKDLRSSVEFPVTLCDFMDKPSNWSRKLQTLKYVDKLWIMIRVVLMQNAGSQLQCSDIARKTQRCPDLEAAIRTCAPVFIYKGLTKCFAGDIQWFDRCLDAYCGKSVEKCRELKTKTAECGLSPIPSNSKLIRPFKYLLQSCER